MDLALVVVGQTVRGQGPCLLELCLEASSPPATQLGCSIDDGRGGALVDLAEPERLSSARSPQMGDDGTRTRLRITTINL